MRSTSTIRRLLGFVVGAAGSSYWNVRGVGTAVIGNVPGEAAAGRDRHEIADGAVVRDRRPDRGRRPDGACTGTAGVTVPPPETGRPVTVCSYVNDRETGTDVIVNVPL